MHPKNPRQSLSGRPLRTFAIRVLASTLAVSLVLSAWTPVRAADSSSDAALKATLQKRLLVPDAKNLDVGPPSPGPFPGITSRTVTLVNPENAGQKVQIEVFSDEGGKKLLIAQHYAVVDGSDPWERSDLKSVHLDDRATLGPANAPVTIIEFGDFECPYCAHAFNEIETVVNTTYKGRVHLIWKNFPLNVHPWAEQGAVAAECAREQNPAKFWDFARSLYRDQTEITPRGWRREYE